MCCHSFLHSMIMKQEMAWVVTLEFINYGATYVYYPCFPPEYQSSLNSIYIALLFYLADRKEFGNDAICYKLIEELTFLQKLGIELNLPQ